MMEFSSGFLLSLSLCLDIGIANIAMMTLAMQQGFRQGMWLGVGTCTGDLIYAVLALAGAVYVLQFTPVRWVIWIGGSAVLIYFALNMLYSALRPQALTLASASSEAPPQGGQYQYFTRGMLLALSSPTAILWFAAVGGAIIAQMGQGGWMSSALFLSGFVLAGILWAAVLCACAHHGGTLLGARLLQYTYIASALIFSYFAIYVMYSGYTDFILAAD